MLAVDVIFFNTEGTEQQSFTELFLGEVTDGTFEGWV